MNHIYRSIWNVALGAWVAVPETAHGQGAASGQTRRTRRHRLTLAVMLAAGLLATGEAFGACEEHPLDQDYTVWCTGTIVGGYDATYTSAAWNTDPELRLMNEAEISSIYGTPAIQITDFGFVAVTNNSTINSRESAAAAAAGIRVNHSSSGIEISNIGTISGVYSHEAPLTFGNQALLLQQTTPDKKTIIENASIINMWSTDTSAGPDVDAKAASIISYGGGQTILTNTGTITGRIGLGTSSGNTVINAGAIDSIHLGNATGAGNTFTAVSGSRINASGNAAAVAMPGVTGVQLAASGTVDAGTNGANGKNTLILQNLVDGPGSGTNGDRTVIDWDQYLNFQDLTINSGTWDLLGEKTTVRGTITLNDGLVSINHNLAFGTALIRAYGGKIASATLPIHQPNLRNSIDLQSELTLIGTITLSGQLHGTGSLAINNGALTLGNLHFGSPSTFSGGIKLNNSVLVLNTNNTLGSGTLNVSGQSSLYSLSITTTTIENQIELNDEAKLTLWHAPLILNGPISGNGSLLTSQDGNLTINGVNTFEGGVNLSTGKLKLGNSSALGYGALTVNGAVSLEGSAALHLPNSLKLSAGLTLNGDQPMTLDGSITGNGSLTKQGTTQLTLNSSSNTFSGGVMLAAGSLLLGDAKALGTGTLTVSGNAALDRNPYASLLPDDPLTLNNPIVLNANLNLGGVSQPIQLAGTISGTGSLTKNGSGTLHLSDSNTFSGGTNLEGGRLTLSHGKSLGTGALNVKGNTELMLDAGVSVLDNDIVLNQQLTLSGNGTDILNGILSGNGSLITDRTGTLTLNAINTYTGGITVKAGTLALGANGSLSKTGAVNLASADTHLDISQSGDQTIGELSGAAGSRVTLGQNTLTLGNAANATFQGVIAGAGGLVKQGSGIQTLTGANTYTGGTTIRGGTLAIGTNGSLSDTGAVSLTGTAARFDISAAQQNQAIGSLSGVTGTYVMLGERTLALNGIGNATFDGVITGQGGLIKRGNGTQTLGGANTFRGGVDLKAGILVLGNSSALGTGALRVGGAALLDSTSAITLANDIAMETSASYLELVGSHDLTLNGTISGYGNNFIKNGAATLYLGGDNTYTGDTTINSGTLAITQRGNLAAASALNLAGYSVLDISAGNSQIIGSLAGVSGSTVTLGGNSLTLDGVTNSTFSGSITGNGSLVKRGDGVQTLNGASRFSGGVALHDGGLVVGDNAALGSGTLTVGGAATLSSGKAVTLANDIKLNAGLTVLGDHALTLNGSLSGNGSLTKEGTAALTLNGINTYTGGTTVKAGTLALGAGASLNASGMVHLDDGTILDLSAGNGKQTFGTLSGTGAVNLGANFIEVGDASNGTFSGAIAGSGGLIKTGAGTETLTGANTYTGSTIIQAGTLAIGAGGSLSGSSAVTLTAAGTAFDISAGGSQAIGSLAGVANTSVMLGAQTLTLNGIGNATFHGAIAGQGGLVKDGDGTQTLGGANMFAGGVSLNAGGLVIGHANALGTGDLSVTGNATLDNTAALDLGNDIALTSGANLDLTGSHALTLSGTISGSGGLVKNGAATVTLDDISSHTGITTINSGTLAVGTGGSLSTASAVNLAGTGTLDIRQGGNQQIAGLAGVAGSSVTLGNNTLTTGANNANSLFAGSISGAGGLTQTGTGILTLAGNNDYSGATLIAAGAFLQAGNGSGGTLGAGAVTNNGTLILNRSNAVTIANDISGAGNLTKAGGGTTVLTGDNRYTGNTVIEAGILQVGNGGASGTLGAGAVTNNAALVLNRSNAMTVANDIDGSGSLTQAGSGATILTGNNRYAGATTITAGMLQIGAGGTTGSLGAGAVTNHGTLAFHRSDNLTVNGNISGTGSLTQAGAGVVTLLGNTSHSGNTRVDAGQLIFAGNSNVLGGNVQVVASAGLTIAANAAMAVAGDITLGDNAALTIGSTLPGPNLTADSLHIGAGVRFSLSGISTASELDRVLISTANGITGDFHPVAVGGFNGAVDYLTVHTRKSADQLQYLASYGLNWTADNTQAHGTFTLDNATDSFDVGAALHDQSANAAQHWDGTSLTKNGAGTLVLSADNRHTGVTTINGGVLQIGSGGTAGTLGTGAVINHAALAFQRSDSSIVANTISGAGQLRQLGTGTTILTGSNSYTGATHIAAGTLQAGDGGVTGNLGSGDIANHGALAVNRSDAVTLAQDISGTGVLQQLGGGTTTLTGANAYTGGTVVAAGTLRAGSADALVQNTVYAIRQGATLDLNGHALQAAQLTGDGNLLLGAAALTLDSAADQTHALDVRIQGSGHLIKRGEGALALNGDNDFSGGVNLKQGAIRLGHAQGLGTGVLSMDDGTSLTLARHGMVIANDLHMTGDNDPVIDTGANHGTWSGNITGAGFLTKQGAGMLTLAGTGNTYTGATHVAQGTLQAGAANTFSSVSAHTVAAGALLDLDGHHQTLASLNNSGTVQLGGNGANAPGTILKITGPYAGNNGTLGIATVLEADGSATDKMLLSGAGAIASGSTSIQITNAGGLGAQTTGAGIQVIATEHGASLEPGSFTLAGGLVAAGAFEYRLFQDAQGAALKSTIKQDVIAYRSEAALLSALPAQLRQADMAMLGDMRKRMGDDRPQADGATATASQGRQHRAWGRYLRTDPSIRQQGTASPESRGHLTGFQAGVDLLATDTFQAGLYVGQLQGDMHTAGFAGGIAAKDVGRNSLRNRYVGVYGSWQDSSGLYVDAVLQGAEYRSNLRADNGMAGKSSATTKGHGWLASLEVGKPVALGGQWRIEPQAQLIYRKLNLNDTALSLATVKTKADADWTLRLGARIKGSIDIGAHLLQPYGRINVYKTSRGTDVASFITPVATTDVTARNGYTATEAAVGASLNIDRHASVYGEVGKLWANGGDSRIKSGIQASFGVRVLW